MLRDKWVTAVEQGRVYIVPGGATEWRRVERVDQLRELRRWARVEERERGWLILKDGVPSHFVKSNGTDEPLKIEDSSLTVLGYNLLTSTEDGNPHELSVYEEELGASGKHRYWKNRKDNAAKALNGCHVVGLCEATVHMLRDLVELKPHLRIAHHALKPGDFDGSAVLVDHSRIRVRKSVRQQLMTGMSQIFLASLLEDTDTGTVFWFVVLHLQSDGFGAHGSREYVRVKQATRAAKMIDKLQPRAPTVVVGDLNSDRFLYPAFEEHGQPHVLNVFSEFSSALPLKPTYHHYGRAAFDHILVRGADVVQAYVPDAGGVCPNEKQGSDHLPVRATVVLLEHDSTSP